MSQMVIVLQVIQKWEKRLHYVGTYKPHTTFFHYDLPFSLRWPCKPDIRDRCSSPNIGALSYKCKCGGVESVSCLLWAIYMYVCECMFFITWVIPPWHGINHKIYGSLPCTGRPGWAAFRCPPPLRFASYAESDKNVYHAVKAQMENLPRIWSLQ